MSKGAPSPWAPAAPAAPPLRGSAFSSIRASGIVPRISRTSVGLDGFAAAPAGEPDAPDGRGAPAAGAAAGTEPAGESSSTIFILLSTSLRPMAAPETSAKSKTAQAQAYGRAGGVSRTRIPPPH